MNCVSFAPYHNLVHSSSTTMLQRGPCTLAENKGASDTFSKQAQLCSDIWKFVLTHLFFFHHSQIMSSVWTFVDVLPVFSLEKVVCLFTSTVCLPAYCRPASDFSTSITQVTSLVQLRLRQSSIISSSIYYIITSTHWPPDKSV